jgi:hypothetical protein
MTLEVFHMLPLWLFLRSIYFNVSLLDKCLISSVRYCGFIREISHSNRLIMLRQASILLGLALVGTVRAGIDSWVSPEYVSY